MCTKMPVVVWLAAVTACVAQAVGPNSTAETPPQSVAQAMAIATKLAGATGSAGQAELSAQADCLAAMQAAWIVPSLAAFGNATPAGANWLRSGLERAADRLGDALPAAELTAFVADVAQPPRARSLAFTWLKARAPSQADALLAAMLDDPSLDLRREAVEKLLESAAGDGAGAQAGTAVEKEIYRRGLAAARDVDQLEQIASWLTEHGEPTDIAVVLGFVRNWRVSAAFDNAKGVGFARAYPVEIEHAATPVPEGWKAVASTDKHGTIDLNAAIATEKGVLAYAVAAVEMPRGGLAEVRVGSPCAVAVWVNGKRVMAHEIYHASEAIDQYVATADFRAGNNVVLVKCCQNEQTEAWASDWKFQLRICDPLGKPLATQMPATQKQEAGDGKAP